MRQIIPDVYLIEGLRGCHVYLLVTGKDLVLVDSGTAGGADRIVTEVQAGGFSASDLRSIVLTHAHGDHTGNVVELVRRSGAQVLAHRAEVPYIERTESLPAASVLLRLLFWLSDRLMLRQATCTVDRSLEDGDVIEALGGLQVIHTPGHTPGSICLYQPDRQLLCCGDALFNVNPMTGRGGLQLAIPLFSTDMAQVRSSAHKLAALPISVLCPGHGEPILQGAVEQIRLLLE
jgi:glyoxylase-like metal-dependent hydrolase (beta-lactamase superfamily II)